MRDSTEDDGALLGRCAQLLLLLLACFAASLSDAARAQSASPSALPDFLWSDIPVDTKRLAPAPAGDTSSLPRREVREPLSLPRPIDLTQSPDDIWERIRRGFAMPNLDSPLVRNRQVYYAGQKAYFERMVARSRRYLYHIVEEVEKRGMPTEIALL